jgi:hypothetical protein
MIDNTRSWSLVRECAAEIREGGMTALVPAFTLIADRLAVPADNKDEVLHELATAVLDVLR